MAQKMMTVCDVPVRGVAHGVPATVGIAIEIQGKLHQGKYHADVCDDHVEFVESALKSIGIEIGAAKRTNGHTRRRGPAKKTVNTTAKKTPRQLTAKSGEKFTTADAREWLVKEGKLPENQTGRIQRDLLNLYAEAH